MKIKQGKKTSNKQVPGFFRPREVYKLPHVSEQNASGVCMNRNDLGKATSKNLCTKVPLDTKSKIKLSHTQTGLIPLTVYHQNIRGLRAKATELTSQLYPTFPHILCISEHHMNHLELQQTFF
jgi:hypothetical protein